MPSPVHISELQADYQNNEAATAQTVKVMCSHVRDTWNDTAVHGAATAALLEAGAPFADRRRIAGCVWDWIKRNITFETDESQLSRLLGRQDELELLISPAVLLRARRPAGDCDDFTMLACSMLQSLGVPALIKTFKCDRSEPWRWSHVCAAAVLENGSILPVDASHGDYCGWEVPARDVYQSQLWDMQGNKVEALNVRRNKGLSGYAAEPGWSGNIESSTGAVAGPYGAMNFPAVYGGGGSRASALQAIARGKFRRGMGDSGYDEFGVAQQDFTPITDSLPAGSFLDLQSGDVVDSKTGAILSGPLAGGGYSSGSGGSSSSGFNLSSFLSSLIAPAASLTSQEIAASNGVTKLANGSYVLPNGTVVSGTSSTGVSSSMLLVLLALGVVVLIASKK